MINYLAQRTIRGDFGNGQERKEILGPFYAPVQNEVNRQLGYPKRYQANTSIGKNLKSK